MTHPAVLQADRDIMLLREADVRADLELTESQETAVQEMLQEYENRWREQAQRREDRRQAVHPLELARQKHQALAGILTATQQTRLHQISLQKQVPGIFRNSEVIRALELTDQQRQQIRHLEMRSLFARRDHRTPEPAQRRDREHRPSPRKPLEAPRPDEAYRPGPEDNRKPQPDQRSGPTQAVDTLSEILKLLTPDQQARWQELTGKPFQPVPQNRGTR